MNPKHIPINTKNATPRMLQRKCFGFKLDRKDLGVYVGSVRQLSVDIFVMYCPFIFIGETQL